MIRKRKLRLGDLYVGDASSIDWFRHGYNWRVFVAFFAGVWPLLPGLVGTVNDYTDASFVGWIRPCNLTFIVGLAISLVVFWLLNMLFPVSGIGQDAPFVDEGAAPATPTSDAYTVTKGQPSVAVHACVV